jgi:hypothetical protein
MHGEEVAQHDASGPHPVATAAGREVAPVLPQPAQASVDGIRTRRRGRFRGRQAFFHIHRSGWRAVGDHRPAVEGAQEAPDVPAAADGAQVVEGFEQAEFGQPLEGTQGKGGASDAPARQGNPHDGNAGLRQHGLLATRRDQDLLGPFQHLGEAGGKRFFRGPKGGPEVRIRGHGISQLGSGICKATYDRQPALRQGLSTFYIYFCISTSRLPAGLSLSSFKSNSRNHR